MLDCSPQNLSGEIKAALTLRDKRIRAIDLLRMQYKSAMLEFTDDPFQPENMPFSYVSLIASKAAFSNPKARVTSRRPWDPLSTYFAAAFEQDVNQWIAEFDPIKVIRRVIVDMALGYGVTIVREVEHPTMPGQTRWPALERIPPEYFLYDPHAFDDEHCRYKGHIIVSDREDLLERAEAAPDEGWNVELIRKLGDDDGITELKRTAQDVPTRHEIAYVELRVPEKGADGFNGTLYTIPLSGADDYLREPRDYWGPPWWHYQEWWALPIPNSVLGLAPLVANAGQNMRVNEFAVNLSISAARQKTIYLLEALDKEIGKKIVDARDGDALIVDGVDKQKVAELKLGSVESSRVSLYQIELDRLRRNLGMSELEQGQVSGAATATENALASNANQERMSNIVRQVRDNTRDALKSVGYLMFERYKAMLGMEGQALESNGLRYSDLEIDIDLNSMGYASPEQDVAKLGQVNELLNVAMALPQAPHIDAKGLFDIYERLTGVHGLSAILNPQGLQDAREMLKQQAQQPGGPPPRGTQTSTSLRLTQTRPTPANQRQAAALGKQGPKMQANYGLNPGSNTKRKTA
jgi:hypothetical protein